jgi:methylglutaconyl-CoA hydratase
MINYTVEGAVARLRLNRPDKRNALHPKLVEEMKLKLNEAAKDKNVNVLIVTGEGSSFCAGADLSYLNDLREYSAVDNERDSENLAGLFLQIYHFPKPTIAAVNGPAIAGGCGLASVCDFIVAHPENSKFGYTEVKIGFIPAVVSIFLINKIGEGKAKRLLLTGSIINGSEAYDLGLADYLTDNVEHESFELADKLLEKSQTSLIMTKKMINDISGLNVNDAVNYCINLNAVSRSSEDFKNGLINFLNKK